MPEWYPTIALAKYYGISPETAYKMHPYWKERTYIAMTAESQAQEILSQHR